jgi:hypothetical protein
MSVRAEEAGAGVWLSSDFRLLIKNHHAVNRAIVSINAAKDSVLWIMLVEDPYSTKAD